MHIRYVQLKIIADFKKSNKTSKDLSILWRGKCAQAYIAGSEKKHKILKGEWKNERKKDIKINYTPPSIHRVFFLSFSLSLSSSLLSATLAVFSILARGKTIVIFMLWCFDVWAHELNLILSNHWKRLMLIPKKKKLYLPTYFIWKMKHKTCADKLNKLLVLSIFFFFRFKWKNESPMNGHNNS